jgi:hypothetical protein
MSKAIGVCLGGGEVEWHAPGVVQDYDTLCGLDANEPGEGLHGTIVAPRGQKITCAECASIFVRTQELGLRRASFDARVLAGMYD